MTTPVPSSGNTLDGAIRDLAAQINQPDSPVTPTTVVKGVVTAFASSASPPTVSITLSGDTAVIDGVRFLESYSPTVGDTVAISKMGSDILILGAYAVGATGWNAPTLSSGFTTNGDSQGNVMYRLVFDNGSLKMQWQGAVARSANTTVISSANLVAPFRPSVKRKVLVARGFGGGSVAVQIIFNTDGSVVLDGSTFTISLGNSGVESNTHSHALGTSDTRLSGFLSSGGSDLGHAHGLGSSGQDSVDHSHGLGTAAPTAPDWVSFNQVEYFL